MKTYDFYLDTKVTDWYRTSFEIEANSLKEAKELAIKFIENDHHGEIPWEQVEGTIEVMSVKGNNGQPTKELHTDDFYTIWDNT